MLRCAETALLKGPAHDDDGSIWLPWGVEQPRPGEGEPSGMNFNETLAIKENKSLAGEFVTRAR